MLNQSAEYALRTTLHMAAQGPEKAFKAAVVAQALGLPPTYLAKVMHDLVRAGVLKSVRGPQGGYTLAVAPADLAIRQVISPFHDHGRHIAPCLMGAGRCDPQHPCTAHQRWARAREHFDAFLENTTLAELLIPTQQAVNSTLTLTEVA